MERVRVVACESKPKSRKKLAKHWQFEHLAPEGVTVEEAERRCVEVIARLVEGAR